MLQGFLPRCLALVVALLPVQSIWASPDIDRASLIASLKQQTRLPDDYIKCSIASARFDPSVIERITTPYESRPYAEYRPLFVTEKMKALGRAYLHEHRKLFDAVWKRYRVEPEIIAAILGLETRFGRNRGSDRVIDSLFTLATGYPRRSEFFTRELGELLQLAHEEHIAPESILGSYAGAFGVTQFIPSSYRAYAVDADADGRRDVWHSTADILASVANYFQRHGWQAGRPVAYWLPGTVKDYSGELKMMADTGFGRWHALGEIRSKLPVLPAAWKDEDQVALIEMQTQQGHRIALVHRNFHVITRWNRSYNYAMAVTEVAAMLGCKSCSVD